MTACMKIDDLDYEFPEHLIATTPRKSSRIMWVGGDNKPEELTKNELLDRISCDDILIINDTKVLKCRVFSQAEEDVLFLNSTDGLTWQVLFPAKKFKCGHRLQMPGGIELELLEKGLPQRVRASQPITSSYFEQFGEMPIPPYIQQARGCRHNNAQDYLSYQSDWALKEGSQAAPTASLHFTKEDLEQLRKKGVCVESITLHVGAGTFFPVKEFELQNHSIHKEWVEISRQTRNQIIKIKNQGGKCWALGTTVTRAVESVMHDQLKVSEVGDYLGMTQLFIYPPFEFKVVDRLLTNFHQPKSTLLALVSAFSGINCVKESYRWAIERSFMLFSYGDLSVWIRRESE